MGVGGPLSDASNDAGGNLGSPSDPLGRQATLLATAADPTDKTPPPPNNFALTLLPDGKTIRLSCNVLTFAPLQTGRFVNQSVRFYITPMSLSQVPSSPTKAQSDALFGRAILLQQLIAPRKGGQVVFDIPFSADGTGVYWATQFNSRWGQESEPAGPVSLKTADYQAGLDHIPPTPITDMAATLSVITPPLTSTLKLMNVQIGFNPPSNQAHFSGVILFWVNYFGNFIGSTIQEGGFYHWDGTIPSTINVTMPADYNSTGFGAYLISHTVTLYVVSVNTAHTYAGPFTDHASQAFTPGIGT